MAQTAARTTWPGDVRFETHGGALLNVLRASGAIADFARARWEALGGVPGDQRAGEAPMVPDWFPLHANLRVLDDVARAFGDVALFDIGVTVPKHATFPPEIRSMRQALEVLDIAFHTNHRRDGVVMYDPATGTMLDGIGHYLCERAASDALIALSTSVYPCRFDLGLVSGLAARFDASAKVQHAADGVCRVRGDVRCRYVVLSSSAAGEQP
jgi:hypothetical protein